MTFPATSLAFSTFAYVELLSATAVVPGNSMADHNWESPESTFVETGDSLFLYVFDRLYLSK